MGYLLHLLPTLCLALVHHSYLVSLKLLNMQRPISLQLLKPLGCCTLPPNNPSSPKQKWANGREAHAPKQLSRSKATGHVMRSP